MLNGMSRDIPERDWKVFPEIHRVARERFCERVLSEIASASSASDQGAHERYIKVFEIVRDKDKELGALRQSAAIECARTTLQDCIGWSVHGCGTVPLFARNAQFYQSVRYQTHLTNRVDLISAS